MNTLIEHKNVVAAASKIILSAYAVGSDVRVDEEKQEVNIQMQEIEGGQDGQPGVGDNVAEEQK